LRKNIDETIDFLSGCDDDELDAVIDIIEMLIFDVKREQSEAVYDDFIEFLQELAESHPKTELKEDLEDTLKAIKEDEDEKADNDGE
jgi:hypothetical protein